MYNFAHGDDTTKPCQVIVSIIASAGAITFQLPFCRNGCQKAQVDLRLIQSMTLAHSVIHHAWPHASLQTACPVQPTCEFIALQVQ